MRTGLAAWQWAERKVVKVVMADKLLGGRVHGLMIKRLRHPPGAVRLQRQTGRPVYDAVEIMATECGETCVEIIGRGLDVDDRDLLAGLGQMGVERVAQLVGHPGA